jgi:UDP-N-acetyl-2-amino-2-deoxyglucuronate dehydrogenase
MLGGLAPESASQRAKRTYPKGRRNHMTTYIGLIGGGNITDTHARAAHAVPGVEIAAIYGTNSAKVARLCREHGGEPFADFDTFLRHRPMDLVVIGSPSGLHAAQGIRAAERGLHVLTEKPIDISAQRADALIAAAEHAGVKLGVIFQDRVKPGIRQLKTWVREGRVGKPLFADARVKWYRPREYYSSSRWRGKMALDGGGALMNQGVHTVDLLLWLLGDVVQVQARAATALHAIESEDTVVAILEFASGALGVLQATTAAYPGYPRRLEITGSEGTVILEHDRIIHVDLQNPPAGGGADFPPDANESASSPVVSDFRGHQAVIEDFLEAIDQNRPPLCDGREGRRSVALVEAVYRAAQNSEKIAVG